MRIFQVDVGFFKWKIRVGGQKPSGPIFLYFLNRKGKGQGIYKFFFFLFQNSHLSCLYIFFSQGSSVLMHHKNESEEWIRYPKLCSKSSGLCSSSPGKEAILLGGCRREEATLTRTPKPKSWRSPALLCSSITASSKG